MRLFKTYCLAIVMLLFITSCEDNVLYEGASVTDTANKEKIKKAPPFKKQAVNYHVLSIKDSGIKALKKYSLKEQHIILEINRVDRKHVRKVDTLVVPDRFLEDMRHYSPFPSRVTSLEEVKKIIFFSYPTQAWAIYEYGDMKRWGATSMGKESAQTPTGLHFANWKGEEVQSTVDDEWILKWNFNIMNKEGVGWHQYDMPGYPASHSCLRLFEKDARFLYEWADQWVIEGTDNIKAHGTPTIVFGAYPFGERKPWLHLLDDKNALTISEDEIDELVKPHLDKILQEQEKLQRVKAAQKAEKAENID